MFLLKPKPPTRRFRLLILLFVTTPSFALRALWHRVLRRYYLAEASGTGRGGVVFIRCEKN